MVDNAWGRHRARAESIREEWASLIGLADYGLSV